MNKCEYKVIRGNDEYVQKVLNQWKHEFELNIISVLHDSSYDRKDLIIVLKRNKK